MIPNNIVAVFEYPNQIRPAVRAFIDNTDPTLIKDITKNTSSSVVITLTDNTIYYFMTVAAYRSWQYGMTYRLYGDATNTSYHSGHPYQDLHG